jgi:hypothetical protein
MVGGASLLMVAALLTTFVGGASAAPVSPSASSTVAWAYGGTNSSSGSITVGTTSLSWSVTAGVAVIFNATPTVANTTELQVQRTVGLSVQLSLSTANGSASFTLKGVEVDNAYANVTNASQVDANGTMVPALGLINSSISAKASLNEALVGSNGSTSAFAYLNVSGAAQGAVQFAPALGLVPLNLTGITEWNSTAIATPSAAWNYSWDFAYRGWNGSSGHGGANGSGAWNSTGPVDLSGMVVSMPWAHFHDHALRTAIVLMVAGPADLYDGFLLVPHGFDLFGGQHHDFDAESVSTSAISGHEVFVTGGHLQVTSFSASHVAFGASTPPIALSPMGGAVPAVSSPASAGTTGSVLAQPESVSTAQSQSHCLQFGCSAAGPWYGGLAGAALVGALIAAVVGTVGVIEWRSYSRRKTAKNQLVGGYSEGMVHGVPPGAVQPSTPATHLPSTGGPEAPTGPGPQH